MLPPRFLNLEYFYNLIYQAFLGADAPAWWGGVIFWSRVVLLALTPILMLVVVILTRKIGKLRQAEAVDLEMMQKNALAEPEKDARWEAALKHFASANSEEWKLSIIEADKILDDLVKKLNYPGETLGERLKKIEPSDFLTLDDAWEAHKLRNRIAHESGLVLSRRQVVEAIERYKRVFEEFGLI